MSEYIPVEKMSWYEKGDPSNNYAKTKESDRIAELEKQNREMLELLKELEWGNAFRECVNEQWVEMCPVCGGGKNMGHIDDCKLAKILREVGG